MRYSSSRQTLLRATLVALLPLCAFAADFQTPAITSKDLAARQGTDGRLLIIDVRDNREYKSGHVPGAINIPHTKLQKHIDELRDANGVVLYCIIGKRTRLAEQTLIEQDIPRVMHLEGGLNGWRQSGFEVRTGWGP